MTQVLRQMKEKDQKLQEQNRMIEEQNRKIAEMNRKMLEYDHRFNDLMARVTTSAKRSATDGTGFLPTTAQEVLSPDVNGKPVVDQSAQSNPTERDRASSRPVTRKRKAAASTATTTTRSAKVKKSN